MGTGERDVVGGRYRLGPRIGAGGMGEVFRAHHLMTGREVALKWVKAHTLRTLPGSEARVLQEAAACGSVLHPGVVEIFDAGWTERGDIFLVFELLEGQNLERAFRQRRISPRDLVRVGARLLDALEAVHEAGWVHRDVKPGNVFIARGRAGGFSVKLLDFGIAIRIGEGPDEEPLIGTLDYMSPEQARGRPAGPRSDLWAVGALMFRGLIGQAPWPAKEPSELSAVIDAPAPDLLQIRPELCPRLAGIVRRALHPHPSARWADAASFAAALRQVSESPLRDLAPPSMPGPSTQPLRPEPPTLDLPPPARSTW